MTTIFNLPTSLVITTVTPVRDALITWWAEQSDTIVLDAQDVEEVDAAGLQLIASTFKLAQASGFAFTLLHPTPALLKAARTLGLLEPFGIDATGVLP